MVERLGPRCIATVCHVPICYDRALPVVRSSPRLTGPSQMYAPETALARALLGVCEVAFDRSLSCGKSLSAGRREPAR